MMVKQFAPILGFLFIMIFATVFGLLPSADAQKVHALLIILGNDRNIRSSTEKNESNMKKLLRQVSQDCKVRLTVMKSEDEMTGTVTTMTLFEADTSEIEKQNQEIITANQVIQWIKDLRSDSDDTLFLYYSGVGKLTGSNSHTLVFEPGMADNIVARADLTTLMKEKPGRLKMLVTDTCSSRIYTIKPGAHNYASKPIKNRLYIKHLFLQHGGILDITAASPGQEAWGSDALGGLFTASLVESLNVESDTDQDGFLSWTEVFEATHKKTQMLFSNAAKITPNIIKRQKTQEPAAHSLPERIIEP